LWWILPATFAVTIVALNLGKPSILTSYLKWKNRAVLVLLALTTTSTFTVLSSVSVGNWDPNVSRRLTSALVDQTKSKVALRLSSAMTNNGQPNPEIVSSFLNISKVITEKVNSDPFIVLDANGPQNRTDVVNRLIERVAEVGSDAVSSDIVNDSPKSDRSGTIERAKATAADARHEGKIAEELTMQAQAAEAQAGSAIASAAARAMMGDVFGSFAEGDPEIVKRLVEQFLGTTAEKITEKLMSRYKDNIEDKIDFAARLFSLTRIEGFTRIMLHSLSSSLDVTKVEKEIDSEIKRVDGEIGRAPPADGPKDEPRLP
jgi:hypothetical protein